MEEKMNTTPDETPDTLPDKPSELIRVALADLEKCENDPKYEIFMGTWHDPYPSAGVCDVCLAGSVLAKTMGFDPSVYVAPYDHHLSSENSAKLSALDDFRTGDLRVGLSCMGFPESVWQATEDRRMPDYDLEPEKFKAELLELAVFFEGQGL